MKILNTFLIIATTFSLFAQIETTDKMSIGVGSGSTHIYSEDGLSVNYIYAKKKLNDIKGAQYLVFNNGQLPESIELLKEIDDERLIHHSSKANDDFVFDFYYNNKGNLYLSKRSKSDLKEVVSTISIPCTEATLSSRMMVMYVDNGGVYIFLDYTPDYYVNTEKEESFLKRFDNELNEAWSTNTGKFRKDAEDTFIEEISHDLYSRSLNFELNLAEYEGGGLFSKTKKVNEAQIVVALYDEKGTETIFVPSFEDPFVSSQREFYLDSENKSVTGLFIIHNMGEDEYSVVEGIGYMLMVWDLESGDILNENTRMWKHEDVYGIMDAELEELLINNGVSNKGQDAPNFGNSLKISRKANGSFFIWSKDMVRGVESSVESKIPAECRFFCSISNAGEEEWTVVEPGFINQEVLASVETEEVISLIVEGYQDNYSEDGAFDYSVSSGRNNCWAIISVNKNTGEVSRRKLSNTIFKYSVFDRYCYPSGNKMIISIKELKAISSKQTIKWIYTDM